jgi:hypothetical protein
MVLSFSSFLYAMTYKLILLIDQNWINRPVVINDFIDILYNQICIWRTLKGTWKCGLYEQLPFIYRVKWYALFINGNNETPLYRQWFAI